LARVHSGVGERMTQNRPIDDIRLKAKLNDSQQQKGVSWRKTKLEAVAEARKKGYSERSIFIELKKAGLVNHTVNSILDDAWYCSGIEDNEESFIELSPREKLKIDNQRKRAEKNEPLICKNPECKKPLPPNKVYCNEDCLRRFYELTGSSSK